MRFIVSRLCVAAIGLWGFVSCVSKDQNAVLLDRLDYTLEMKDVYDGYFQEKVAMLKNLVADSKDSANIYDLNKRIAKEYEAYSLDSTVTWLRKNRDMAVTAGDGFRLLETDLLLAEEYAMTGYHLEASELLSQYSEVTIPAELKYMYYNTYHVLAGEMMAYTNTEESYREKIANRDRYRNILLSMVAPGTYDWYSLKLEEAEQDDNSGLMREYALKMVELTERNTRKYAQACYFYQNIIKDSRDPEKVEYLIRSAIADVMCATKDYASLNILSKILFGKGDLDRAFHYTAEHSMPDAIFFNGKLRPWQVSQSFPQIDRAYQEKNMKLQRRMVTMIAVVSALVVILVLMLLFIVKRQQVLNAIRRTLQDSYMKIEGQNRELVSVNRKLSSINAQMQEADKVKQEYIALFLSMVSENISTTRKYRNHVLQYIRRGNSAELVSEIEKLPPIDADIAEFYEMFDSTFINLYPDFVEKFNALLVDGAGVYPKNGDILNPELRIFALIKLGIADSGKIASLLHYSANTIYNYKAKVKNLARCDKSCFEDEVRKLL